MAYGRPVGVAIDKQGALLVADDVGNTIWHVTSVSAPQTPSSANGRPLREDAPPAAH
ncbi:MAG TPA: hypothetical protein VG994_07155 [Steroidobacteraceae bacterium]|nr:hypothetical protein [Steroidobacteraceae bacterium]